MAKKWTVTGNDWMIRVELKNWICSFPSISSLKKICNVQNYFGYQKNTLKLQTKSDKDFFIICDPRKHVPKQFKLPKYYSSHDAHCLYYDLNDQKTRHY